MKKRKLRQGIAVMLTLFMTINYSGNRLERFSIVSLADTAAIVTATSLNIRSGPGTNNQAIGKLTYGTSVSVVGQTTGSDGKIWYQIRFSKNGTETTGYASSDYIQFQTSYQTDGDFERYLSGQGFPESYKPALRQLHGQYPNWVFTAQHTNLTWSEVISNESVVGRNLVAGNSPTSWKSMETGAYNWTTGTWVSFDSGSWVAASREIVSYYMDPRNFLNGKYIFQFLRHNYNSSIHTIDGIKSMTQGTFLDDSVDVSGSQSSGVTGNSPGTSPGNGNTIENPNNGGGTGSGNNSTSTSGGPGVTGSSSGSNYGPGATGSSSGGTSSGGTANYGPGVTGGSSGGTNSGSTANYGPGATESSSGGTSSGTSGSNSSGISSGASVNGGPGVSGNTGGSTGNTVQPGVSPGSSSGTNSGVMGSSSGGTGSNTVESIGPGVSSSTGGSSSSGETKNTVQPGVSPGNSSAAASEISIRKKEIVRVGTAIGPGVSVGPGGNTSNSTGPGGTETAAASSSDSSYSAPVASYSEIIMNAAKQSGVNPYVLIAMILQEQGTQGGRSVSGTVAGYEGYYNFFNIEAYKSGSMEAVERGLWFASQSGSYERPWNSIDKAILGGAVYYGVNYVDAGQDTFYLKKFNVQGSNLYKHQYMTNVQAAASEGAKLEEAYSSHLKQMALEFKIPVYLNMPNTPCEMPDSNANPNNRLSSMSVDGFSLSPAFNGDVTEYNLTVGPSVTSVYVRATADSTATITGTGNIQLQSGNTDITIEVKAQNGSVRQYVIHIVRQINSTSQGSGTSTGPGSSSGPGVSGSSGTTNQPQNSGSGTSTIITGGPGQSSSGTGSGQTGPGGSNVTIIR